MIHNRNWLRSVLALVLAVCLMVGLATVALAAPAGSCPNEAALATFVDYTIEYCPQAQDLIDKMVKKVIDDDTYYSMLGMSKTDASIKKMAISAIEGEITDDMMTELGLEATAANRSMLAEEAYVIALMYYDYLEANGDTTVSREGANEVCMKEMIRFGLVKGKNVFNQTAELLADVVYETYQKYLTGGEEDATTYAEKHCLIPHTFTDGECDNCEASLYRIAGDNRYETAFDVADALKAELGVSKFQTIIVASGTDFADALGGSYLAAVKSAPILLTNKFNVDNVHDYINDNLAENGTIYILGGTAAVAASFEEGLPVKPVRLAGDNRYETNLAILKEAGVSADQEILVCTGTDYADSLSASATGKPILLVKKTLLDSQKTYLAGLGTSSKLVVIGGTSAVSANLATSLETYGSVKRLAGDNRFLTSLEIAKYFFPEADSAIVAYGRNYPDGLCGGSLAYVMGAPMLLTNNVNAPTTAAYTLAAGITSGLALGGTSLISDAAVSEIFGQYTEIAVTMK